MKRAFFATLAVLTVFAMVMVSCGGGGGGTIPINPTIPAVVIFDLNGGTAADGTDSVVVPSTVGGFVSLLTDTGLTGPAATPYLTGWNDANGDLAGAPGAFYGVLGNVTLTAVWSATPPGPGGTVPVVEDIKISNGWYTIFKFDLPAGKTVADYGDLNADYKIASTSTKVRARVFGNYVQQDLDIARLMTYTKGDSSCKSSGLRFMAGRNFQQMDNEQCVWRR